MACHVARISQMHSAAAACSQWREAFIEVVLGDTAASRPERCAPCWLFRTTRDRTLRYLLPECSCSSLHCSRALNLNAYKCIANCAVCCCTVCLLLGCDHHRLPIWLPLRSAGLCCCVLGQHRGKQQQQVQPLLHPVLQSVTCQSRRRKVCSST
jgi:hypothetical protein